MLVYSIQRSNLVSIAESAEACAGVAVQSDSRRSAATFRKKAAGGVWLCSWLASLYIIPSTCQKISSLDLYYDIHSHIIFMYINRQRYTCDTCIYIYIYVYIREYTSRAGQAGGGSFQEKKL